MDLCYVFIPGNERGKKIGIVKYGETGFYSVDFDHHDDDESAKDHVRYLNERLGIPLEIEESARNGSMFGWHCPAAQAAVQFFVSRKKRVKAHEAS